VRDRLSWAEDPEADVIELLVVAKKVAVAGDKKVAARMHMPLKMLSVAAMPCGQPTSRREENSRQDIFFRHAGCQDCLLARAETASVECPQGRLGIERVRLRDSLLPLEFLEKHARTLKADSACLVPRLKLIEICIHLTRVHASGIESYPEIMTAAAVPQCPRLRRVRPSTTPAGSVHNLKPASNAVHRLSETRRPLSSPNVPGERRRRRSSKSALAETAVRSDRLLGAFPTSPLKRLKRLADS